MTNRGLKRILETLDSNEKVKQVSTRNGTLYVLPRQSGKIQLFFKYDLVRSPYQVTRLSISEAIAFSAALMDAVSELTEAETK
ncbi:MAG: hypothetical protein SOV61_00935 [Lachnospiraceae bacterium]|nr:hypothetical protein [Lachnospiraceae bacterium]